MQNVKSKTLFPCHEKNTFMILAKISPSAAPTQPLWNLGGRTLNQYGEERPRDDRLYDMAYKSQTPGVPGRRGGAG